MRNKRESKKSDLFWNLFLTGGFASFNQEWRNSKSLLHTVFLFFIPILLVSIIITLGFVASTIFGK
ncbi:hypothetical protein [Ferdinandcohnia sp. Marseille-Q9671]